MIETTLTSLSDELSLFKQSPVASLCVSEPGNILEINDTAVALFQLPRRILINKPLVTMISDLDKRKFNTYLANLNKGEVIDCELDLRLRSGHIFPTMLVSKRYDDEEGRYLFTIITIIDISQQKYIEESLTKTQKELQVLAHHDPLTSLPNRYLFHDRLESALSRTKRNGWLGALVFADVDRFKVINDDYGHIVGDQVLIEVSKRFQEMIRDQDTVCRYSGDEFVLILEDITCEKDAIHVIEKIVERFSKPVYGLIEHPLKITTSLGVCLFNKNDTDTECVIRRADYAMYESKKRGRNCFTLFSEEHSMAQNLNIIMENDLSIAIENKEFHLHFQPQINTVTNQIDGIEVLTRWRHPRKGLIYPDEFIHRMENANLNHYLTQWVLEESCKVANQWLDQGLDFKRLAVNFSPKEFASAQLLQTVQDALDKSGLPPHKLEIEVTEDSIMQNPTLATKLLRKFSEMGIRLSLDDFGTGYSALSYLNDYPFHCIKIDKSFIDHLPAKKNSKTLVDAIISIAKSLDMDVIAEGVESSLQKKYLQEKGCGLMQGFLFSPAVTYENMTNMLKSGKGLSIDKLLTEQRIATC